MITTNPFTDLSARMTGRVVTSADSDWDAVRQVFDLTTDLRPAGIALPRTVDDVAAAIDVNYVCKDNVLIIVRRRDRVVAAAGMDDDPIDVVECDHVAGTIRIPALEPIDAAGRYRRAGDGAGGVPVVQR